MKNTTIEAAEKNAEPNATITRTYKDSVFRMLFNEKQKVIELYNAFFEADYGPDTPVNFTTIKEVLFKTIKNDIAFTIADTFIILVEHQSSINQNLALRDLVYFSTMIQRMIPNKDFYKESAIKIPRPQFIVLYNGTAEMPDFWTINLSDNFKGEGEETSLQLTVKEYNINNGRNPEVLQRCRTLKEYSQFVSIVRERAKKEPLTDLVMKQILEHCIAEDILADFLKKYGTEVISMLFEQLTEEEAREISKQDGFEIGRAEGRTEGRTEGREEGRTVGKAEDILELLSDLGEVSEELKRNIFAQRDLTILKSWLKLAAKSDSVEEFEKGIS